MRCGFCGTDINPGFNTCTGCGATYRKTLPLLANLVVAFAIFLFLAALLVMASTSVSRGIFMAVVAVVIVWLMLKTGRYKWFSSAKSQDLDRRSGR
jgi:uncharacterized membrane protein (DUF485 family)